MKKIIAIICGLAITLTSVVSFAKPSYEYRYWDFETESMVLTEEGQKLWEDALEARKEDPAANKDWPPTYPLRCEERLTFKMNVKGKYIAPILSDVAGNGNIIRCSISQYDRAWYLSLKGNGGTKVFTAGVPMGFEGFNHNTTGSILTFNTYWYVDEDGQGAFDEDLFNSDSDYPRAIYVKGTPKGGKIDSLQLWLPFHKLWDEEIGDYRWLHSTAKIDFGEFNPDVEGQTDVLDCYDIKYEYTGDPTKFEGGRNLYTLLGVGHDEEAYIEEIRKKSELAKKYAYDEGPDNNHKKPLRYKSWNGKMDGGYIQYDFDVLFAGRASLADLNTGAYQYLKGVGQNAAVTVMGIETTRDGKPYASPYPMVCVKGSRGEAWFDISMMAYNSDDGNPDTNSKAVYSKLYKLKNFKDFVKYEDLTKPDDEIEMILYFKDEAKTELDKIVFNFGPLSMGKEELWTIDAERFDFIGDIGSMMMYDNMDEDYFGYVLDMLGIVL